MTTPNDPELIERSRRYANGTIIPEAPGSIRNLIEQTFIAGAEYQRGRMQTLTDMTALYEQSEAELQEANSKVETLERRNQWMAKTTLTIAGQRDLALKQVEELEDFKQHYMSDDHHELRCKLADALAAAQQAFDHSNCYCDACKKASVGHWSPGPCSSRLP